ncbi:major seminal plasma glycoprotein PSP-I-like [Camelus ferus]|uniref:Major seminal plasma glycoprotein PSP-I-like n=1 Tax=Camelus ferus TaxID=419612 RepID=A0A8B8U049_CAMFR|nr:major seminal plasma glycoprotein PSP-I-like [Camelus ferus]
MVQVKGYLYLNILLIPPRSAQSKGPHDCGGHLRGQYGTISTYEGPETECVWTIQVDPGYQLLVIIPFLNLDCGKEYVEILDGPPGSESFGKFCQGLSITNRGSSTNMTVKYSRNPDHPASSYKIVFLRDPLVTT